MIHHRQAFTLIEVIIVLTIMMAFMGFVFPVGTHLKNRALTLKTQVQCLRYRQGLLAYKEHYGYFPPFLQKDQCLHLGNLRAIFTATLTGKDVTGYTAMDHNPDKICFCEFDADELHENGLSDIFLLVREQLSPSEASLRGKHLISSNHNVDWSSEVILFFK
ncbi:MAG: type II secretion system GspH family protein [Puniceicoccales bacterium]|jgi:prepilin-type N-terminal cleavage/methylation domain-containing protein|nr:type II secretion system GspH family protein [Puniceicoccales bacterium]